MTLKGFTATIRTESKEGGKMASGKGGTRMDAVVKLISIFFISLLSFAVGTFVGKSVSEAEFRETALEQGDYKDLHKLHSSEQSDKLSDNEISSLTEEFLDEAENKNRKTASVTKDGYTKMTGDEHSSHKSPSHDDHQGHKEDGHGDKHKKDHPEKSAHNEPAHDKAHDKKSDSHHDSHNKKDSHGAHAEGKGHDEPVHEAAHRMMKGKSPLADELQKRRPSSVLPGLSNMAGQFTVQIASYPSAEEAKVEAAKIKSRGYTAFYIPAKINGRNWYRVSVGLFKNQKSANLYRKELLKDDKISAAIVQKIVN